LPPAPYAISRNNRGRKEERGRSGGRSERNIRGCGGGSGRQKRNMRRGRKGSIREWQGGEQNKEGDQRKGRTYRRGRAS
jgi:hypothetical protein